MNGQTDEVKKWIRKGDHDLRELVTRKMKITVDYNDILDT